MAISLVTGGAGFIGSHVAQCLVEIGHEVVVLDDLSSGFEDQVPKDAVFIKASVLDKEKIQRLFNKYRFNHVFHLAAYAAEGLSNFIKHFNYQNNLIGSINLINSSVNHNVECFVFTSSIAVYGSLKPPFVESADLKPEDSYGIAKLAVEMDLRVTKQLFGLEYIIFRPHNVYGEHQNIGDPYRNVIGIFMNQIMQNKPMTIFGNGQQTRAYTDISDVATIIADSVNVAEARNAVFNIGSDEFYTLNELAEMVSEAMGVSRNVVYLPPRSEVKHAYCSHERIRRVFGPRPTVDLKDGLKRMANWSKKIGARSSSDYKSIEISKNLPPIWVKQT